MCEDLHQRGSKIVSQHVCCVFELLPEGLKSHHWILIVVRGKNLEFDIDSWFFFENLDSLYVSRLDFEHVRNYFRELSVTILLIELIDRQIEANCEHDSISGVDRESESAIRLDPELQEVLNIVISALTAFAASWDSPCTCRCVPFSRLHQLLRFINDLVSTGTGVFDRN